MAIILSEDQKQQIREAGTIPEQYKIVESIIKDAGANNHLDYNPAQEYWYGQAPGINLNITKYFNGESISADEYSLASAQIIAYNYVAGRDGVEIIEITNRIGENVINDILTNGRIPSMEDQLKHDINGALNNGQGSYQDFVNNLVTWGGTLYYWDMVIDGKTIGQHVIDSGRLGEFTNNAAKAALITTKTLTEKALNGEGDHLTTADSANAAFGAIVGIIDSFNDSELEVGVIFAIVLKTLSMVAQNLHIPVQTALDVLGSSNLGPYLGLNKVGTHYYYDPLILDLDGNGIKTIGHNRDQGAMFDNDSDGLKVATGWVAPEDGLLVFDRNGDGIINDGTEVFGDNTDLKNGEKALHGFNALADLDDNNDGKIDALDTDFSNLNIWRDFNSDGISQSSELFTLESLNIKSLNLAYQDTNRTLTGKNVLTQLGSYEKTDGTIHQMGDVNFHFDSLYTEFTNNVEVSAEVGALINIGGSGNVNELHQAMMHSAELKAKVEVLSLAKSANAQKELIFSFLDAWAKTDSNHQPFTKLLEKSLFSNTNQGVIAIRGAAEINYEDIPIEMLEAFELAKPKIAIIDSFLGIKTDSLFFVSLKDVSDTINAINNLYAKLEIFAYKSFYAKAVLPYYLDLLVTDLSEGSLELNFNELHSHFQNISEDNPNDAFENLVEFLSFYSKNLNFIGVQGFDKLVLLADKISNSISTEDMLDISTRLNLFNEKIIVGTDTKDSLKAEIIFGMGGNDSITGGSGNDVINGGTGSNRITGGKGADTVIFDLLTEMVDAANGSFDTWTDFKISEGDVIDISALLNHSTSEELLINDVIGFEKDGKNINLSLKVQDGAEASSHKFLVLTNQTGVNSLDDLINANSVLL